MAIGAGFVTGIVVKLLQGGAIDELLAKRLEDLGEDFIRDQLSGPLGFLDKFSEEGFENQRDAWLNKITKSPLPSLPNLPHKGLLNKIFNIIEKGSKALAGSGKKARGKWTRSAWAKSRNDWLDNHWKHDWRSQPRDPVSGRWLPGRLDRVDPALSARGPKLGRRTKRRRKLRRQARMRGRKAARKMLQRMKA